MLPKLDGITLCKQLRDRGYRLPILLLTARDSSNDIIKGLDAGADDYVVKPCKLEELMARIRALLRREKQSLLPILRRENLCLDSNTCEVTYRGQLVPLTPTEYSLLELFLRNSHRVFNRNEIIDRLWSSAEYPSDDTVRTHIKGLRQKLKAIGADQNTIETVYGIGYRLKPLPRRSQFETTPLVSSLAQNSIQVEHETALVEVWKQCQDKLVARLEVLEEAARILSQQSPLGYELQEQVEREVHTLAGTLGIFGLNEGVRLARQLEHLLQEENPLKTEREVLFKALVNALRWEMETNPTSEPSPCLLIVDDDRVFSEQLANIATAKNLRCAIASSDRQAKDWLARNRPDVILLKLSLTSSDTIEKLACQNPPIPILIVADGGSLTERIEVVRRGAYGFIEQPISAQQAIEAAMQALESNRIKAKIAIVDDDLQLLTSLPKLLTLWGLKSIALPDPQHLLSVFKAFVPDLLVLNVEMPRINGFDLCRVLRCDLRWSRLPILFLSERTDPHTQNQAFACGADDYISKPVAVPELANRILNRLERVKSRTKFE
jgi:DNA-binding response OmpR family regulator/HPt (histidine-containing phosphotransfer) domain-containing protein